MGESGYCNVYRDPVTQVERRGADRIDASVHETVGATKVCKREEQWV
jgi:hypothetical protein